MSSVQTYSVWITEDILSGIISLRAGGSTSIVATIAAPSGYQPGQYSSQDAWVYRNWLSETNQADAYGIDGLFPPPTVSLKLLVADIQDEPTWDAAIAAQEAAAAAASAAINTPSFIGGFMAMDEDDNEEGDPCTITDDTTPFSIVSITTDGGGSMVLQWQSCTDHVYVVQTESSLTPTSSWRDVAWMFGSNQTTSWADTNAAELAQNFYQVVRVNPTNLNNGIPYGWAVAYGLDPLDANLASEDPTGDGYDNYEKYLTGANPNVAYLDIVVNNGNPYTSSQVIPIDPLSTNFPDILISTDPFMSNAVLYANNGSIEYTLANTTNPQSLYLQYSNAQGQSQGPTLVKVITFDTVLPVVAIISPATNAVLNQAFFTLQAVAYDPDPLWTDDARPLQIWINGQPYYNRSETNIYIERFPVPPGTNSFTVTILVANQAGITNQASQTWVVNTSTATNAPNLLTVNLSSSMLLPNVSSIWVEGTVDNDYASVNAIVTSLGTGDVSTNALAVRQNQYEGLVPLESGTNQLVLVASDAAGHATSETFTLISSTEFSAAITNPVFDVYTTAPSNYVSGYVSTQFDAGLPTQTNVVGVLINGVAAVVNWNSPDGNGNVAFWTTNMIPSGVPITGVILVAAGSYGFDPLATGCPPPAEPMIANGGGTTCPPVTIPPAQSQTYEVIHWESHDDNISTAGSYATRPSYYYWGCQPGCGGSEWWAITTRSTEDDVADIGAGEQDQQVDLEVANRCVNDPNPETFSWTPYQSSQSSCAGTNSGSSANCSVNLPKSMSFGTASTDGGWTDIGYCTEGYGGNYTWPTQEIEAYRDRRRGTLTFRPPRSYGTNTVTVIFTFEGMDYRWGGGYSAPLDLSQVTYQGQSPYSYDNAAQTVSYKINVTGGQQYTINQDSFGWPGGSAAYATSVSDWPFVARDTYHYLTFTNFHNLFCQLAGPTNVCVSYTYVNNNNSPPNTLIANTNQVTLTATGSPDDDGSGIYAWSHSRGGTFSTNNCAAASSVTYFAPELAFATPPGTTDKVMVTYTYHGQSYTTNATLNISRPQTLVVIAYTNAVVPLCNGPTNNPVPYKTVVTFNIRDQFDNVMVSSPSCKLALFETFGNFLFGSPDVDLAPGTPLYGIQEAACFNFQTGCHIAYITAPGQITSLGLPFSDQCNQSVDAGHEVAVWNSSSATNPVFEADDTYTIQGAQFHAGTWISYCDPVKATGAKMLTGGSEITVGTTINASN
ncbi:MAG TPA: hypothetical protein VMP11_13495 [Verrucomicrobiae bacterium]|nr:hypothetical protein [Verrucomicrobiae bacterium]